MADEDTGDCCPVARIFSPLDYSVAGSGKSFLERVGLLDAHRNPTPRISPDAFRAHEIPLTAPLPLPSLLSHLHGDPAPDRGQTLDWPHQPEEES